MADAPKKTLYSVTNIQPGPRGIWSDGVLSYVDPADDNVPGSGTVLAELTDDDYDMADCTGYFEFRDPTDEQKKAAGIVDAPKGKQAQAPATATS